MKFVVLLLFYFAVLTYAQNQNCRIDRLPAEYFSTDTPYRNFSSRRLGGFTVPDGGYAFAFQFYRFALGPNDCLYFCPIDDMENCLNLNQADLKGKKCGSEMDHRRATHYYDLATSCFLYFVGQASNISYPGLSGRVFKIEKSTQIYNTPVPCVDLDGYNVYWTLSSDHFSLGLPSNVYAKSDASGTTRLYTQLFSNLRVTIYALSTSSKQPVTFSGISAETGQNVSIGLSDVSDPMALHFKGEVSISYAQTADTFYYYHMLVSRYNDTSTFQSCPNNGVIDMSKQNRLQISGIGGGQEGYKANTKCHWTFTNAPPNSQVMLKINSFTEKAADKVTITGTSAKSLGFSGYYSNWLIYGDRKQNNLEVDFESDAVEEYTKMTIDAAVVDCSCPPNQINITTAEAMNLTIGFNGDYPYCSGLVCQWTIQLFSESNLLLEIRPTDITLLSRADSFKAVATNDNSSSEKPINLQTGVAVQLLDRYAKFTFNASAASYSTAKNLGIAGIVLNVKPIPFASFRAYKWEFDSQHQIRHISGAALDKPYAAAHYSFNSGHQVVLLTIYGPSAGFLVRWESDGQNLEQQIEEAFNTTGTYPIQIQISTNSLTLLMIRTEDGGPEYNALVSVDPNVRLVSNMDLGCGATHPSAIMPMDNKTTIFYQDFSDNTGVDGLSLSYNGDPDFALYRGPTTRDEDQVYGSGFSCDPTNWQLGPPKFVFGRFITVISNKVDANSSISVFCGSKEKSLWVTTFTTSNGVLMSPRYSLPSDAAMRSYSFSVEHTGADNREIRIDFLRKIPQNGTLTIIASDSKGSKTEVFDSKSPTCRASYKYSRLLMNYDWTYSPGDTYTTGGVGTDLPKLAIVLFILLHGFVI
ncbi:unnamed protein product, partial [Mesorhabditis spiculigera]